MFYKKKLLPKPVALDLMAPQQFLKHHDYSEYTCLPHYSPGSVQQEELEKKASITSCSEIIHTSEYVKTKPDPCRR